MRRGRFVLVLLLLFSVYFLWRHAAALEVKSSKTVEESKVARTDLYGDHLPKGGLARLGTNYLRTDFQELAFSDNGRDFYSWDREGLLRVHDVATGKVLRSFILPDPPISGVQFSADGHFLTLGADQQLGHAVAKSLNIWQTTNGKLHHRIQATAAEPFYCWDAALHDGRTLITCGTCGEVVRWDIERGIRRVIRTLPMPVVRIATSLDESHLFVLNPNSLQCLNIADGTECWQLKDGGSGMMLSPDGKTLLIVRSNYDIALLDPATGASLPWPQFPQYQNVWPRWGADGRTLLIQDWNENVVRVWDAEAGKERHRLREISFSLGVTPDGKSLVGRDSQGLQRWDLETAKPLFPNIDDRGHTLTVDVMACSPDGKLSGIERTRRDHAATGTCVRAG